MTPPPVSRRRFLAGATTVAATAAFAKSVGFDRAEPAAAATPKPASPPPAGFQLRWLDGTPTTTTGAAWGVPWPSGQVHRSTSFALTTRSGAAVPVQSWPLAYWPDGSVKWTGHCVASDAGLEDVLKLAPGKPAKPAATVTAKTRGHTVVLSNGVLDVVLGSTGTAAVASISRAGRVTAKTGRLVLQVQNKPADSDAEITTTQWLGVVETCEIEQSGPVRAVVKLTGRYRQVGKTGSHGGKTLLPWTVRVYLGAGAESLRIVHSFIWDANLNTDFVRGLGLQFTVPMTDEAHNRHVRFAGPDRGIWGEPVRVLTGLRRDPGAAVRAAQVAGTATPPVSQWAATVAAGYQDLPVWGDFTLSQNDARSFSVRKRTAATHSWLSEAGHGSQAPGLGYVGGISGGFGFGIRDFWQQYPRALDIRNAGSDNATATLWSWSPHGEAMDMRSYDTAGHGLDLAYEDNRQGFGVPTGIARSTQFELWAFPATPSRSRLADLAEALSRPPQIVATPQTYHDAGVFGRWSLPDRSTAARAKLEDSITSSIAFYADQIAQRQWYGFWNYGDVMHTYDADRHVWRYDVGGFGWDNAELGMDGMLWYAFLRSGDAKTFRLAAALTRHVAETDSYHAGPYAGLGSRHNVVQWGDGAKEARVGEAYTKRFSYYVTADELIGDWLKSALQADKTLLTVDPLRDILPPQTKAPTRIRIGPDWYALVGNWLTEWERTGNSKWLDRIVTGMTDIATFPAGLFTGEGGGAVGFDPKTGHVINLDKGDFTGGYNLAMPFLGDQIMFETIGLVDVPAFRQTLLDFARYVQAPAAEQIARYGRSFDPQVFGVIYSRVTAWAGEQLNDPTIRQRGWDKFTADPTSKPWPAPVPVNGIDVLSPVTEIPLGDFATNDAAQRNLAIIELLAIAPQEAP